MRRVFDIRAGWSATALDRCAPIRRSAKRGRTHVKQVSRKVIAVGLVAAVAAVVATGAASSAASAPAIQACGLMPDTKTSVRWEQFDKPYLDQGLQGRRRLGPRRQRAGRPAEAEDAGRPVHRRRREGPDHRSDRLRLGGRDREGGRWRRASSRSTTTARSRAASPSLYASFDGHTVGVLQGTAVANALKGKKRRGRRRAERRPGGCELVPVQGRVRLDPEAAVQERHAQEGPGSVRARLGQPEGRHDLRADARSRPATRSTASPRPTTASRTRSSSR